MTKQIDRATALADLEEVRKAVFGDVGDEPNVYADYDRLSELAGKMRHALAALGYDPNKGIYDAEGKIRDPGEVAPPQALDLSNLLRHAFYTGAGYGDLQRLTDFDQKRWLDYDPTGLAQFKRIDAALRGPSAAPAPVQHLVADDATKAAFNHGYVLACCNIANLHDEPSIAFDVLRELGITKAEVKAMELCDYDAKALCKIERSRGNSSLYEKAKSPAPVSNLVAEPVVPITAGMPELRVSLIARAVRQSLRNYGHKVAESTLPECIAGDVERTLAAHERTWTPSKLPRDCGINGGDLSESRDNIGSAYTRSTPSPQSNLRGSALRAHYERELTRILAEWEERRDVLLSDEEAKGRFLILRSFELAAEGQE